MESVEPSSAAPVETTEAKPAPVAAKPFDFRHPSFLSSSEWRKLRMELDEFTESLGALLSTYLRLDFGLQIGKLHTLPFNEFTGSLPASTHVVMFKQEPLRGIALCEVRPLLALALVDRMLGGPGKAPAAVRAMTEMEIALLDQVVQIVLNEWSEQWREIQELRPEILGHENNPKFLQTSSGDTNLLIINLQARIGGLVEEINIAMPCHSLEPVIKQVAAAATSVSQTPPAGPVAPPSPVKWNRNLDNVPVNLTARWPVMKLTARELLALKPGEILELSPGLAEKVEVRIGSLAKFKGRLGTSQNKWAIQISEVSKLV